jgi:hypothetical protein
LRSSSDDMPRVLTRTRCAPSAGDPSPDLWFLADDGTVSPSYRQRKKSKRCQGR